MVKKNAMHTNKYVPSGCTDKQQSAFETNAERSSLEFRKYLDDKFKGDIPPNFLFDIEWVLWSHARVDKIAYATNKENETHKKTIHEIYENVGAIYLWFEKNFNGNMSSVESATIVYHLNQLFMSAMYIGNYTSIVFPYRERLAHVRKQRTRGMASAEARLAKAAATWEPIALELAKASRKKDEGLSQDDLADYILLNWKNNKILCPGHATLKKRISIWIKEKKLPDKVR